MKKILCILPGIILFLLFILQHHNFQLFPVFRGFDSSDHYAYVTYLKTHHAIPMPHEGWELYQPPLYYLLISTLSNPFFIRYFNLSIYICFLIVTFFFFRKITKNSFLSYFSVIIIATLPVIIYSLPTISNELFSGIIISITLMYYVLFSKRFTFIDQVITGCLLGISMLSKATAFVLLICIVIDQIIQNRHNLNKLIKHLFVILGLVFIISGWFYIRNLVLYRNLFASSVDFKQFRIVQTPGFRDVRFFTDLSGFIKADLFTSQHYSLWSGTYFSWFYDGHNVVIPVQPFSKAGGALLIVTFPIFLFSIFGYIKEIRSKDKSIVMIIYPLILFSAYIAYTIKLPFYSTVKGIYLVSLAIPFTYFIIRFLIPFKKYYGVIIAYFTLIVLLVIKNFWILKGWYN